MNALAGTQQQLMNTEMNIYGKAEISALYRMRKGIVGRGFLVIPSYLNQMEKLLIKCYQ